MCNELEQKLDSFNPEQRRQVLKELVQKVNTGQITFPEPGTDVNLHCHTFFSYNCYGYSPTRFAWLARKTGLALAGIVDFDVLDGLEEFLEAAAMLGLKGCAGMETRVFVPEFADKEMNSPGEPGIAYHMGIGFTSADLQLDQQKFLDNLRQTAQKRNRELTERVNKFLAPVELDFEKDVLPLTPSGNATERHICLAYARKAQSLFREENALRKFWSDKLETDDNSIELPESIQLLNTIRAKTMKRGGAGYVQPSKEAFPLMADTNQFVLAAGGIPTITWLDGTSGGEKEIERLIQVAKSTGAAAINIIPDRNYTPGVKNEKLENLQQIVKLADSLDLPIVIGTEMNSPGQKFVDAFSGAELTPFVPVFLKGAHIVYAHSLLQKKCQAGYTSDWAKANFNTTADKNEFFRTVGASIDPKNENILDDLSQDPTPDEILNKLKIRM